MSDFEGDANLRKLVFVHTPPFGEHVYRRMPVVKFNHEMTLDTEHLLRGLFSKTLSRRFEGAVQEQFSRCHFGSAVSPSGWVFKALKQDKNVNSITAG